MRDATQFPAVDGTSSLVRGCPLSAGGDRKPTFVVSLPEEIALEPSHALLQRRSYRTLVWQRWGPLEAARPSPHGVVILEFPS